MSQRRRLLLVFGSTSTIFAVSLYLLPRVGARYWLSFGLLWIFPGLTWGMFMLPNVQPWCEKWCISLGLNFVLTPVSMLLLSYLPGPLTQIQILLAMVTLSGVPVLIAYGWPHAFDRAVDGAAAQRLQISESPTVWFQRRMWWLLVLMVIAAVLRWTNLGYSEFQGDESTVMILAARILEGDLPAMFEHNKGPSELLTVAAAWRLIGTNNEWMARLPFSWANVLAIAAAFLTAQRITSTSAGLLTIMLLGIEGYVLALGRITQYQSLVLVLSILGLLCVLKFYSSGRSILVFLTAMFLAAAGLAHYDAVFVLLPSLALLGVRLWQDRESGTVWLVVVLAGVLAVAVLSLFYWPYLRSDSINNTASYLSQRVGSAFRNNFSSVFTLSAVYDSIYLLLILIAGVFVQVWRAWRRIGRLWGGISAGLILFELGILALSITGRSSPVVWAAGPLLILLGGVLISPRQSWPQRVLWLWLAAPMFFYLFYVLTPYTHVYTFFVPAALLAGCSLAELAAWGMERTKVVRSLVLAAGVLVYSVCSFYAVLMFVQHRPEYRRTFPEYKLAIYWTPYDEIPDFGLFGFPYRAGWKAVAQLFEIGMLDGDYESNEEPPITNYYLRAVPRWHCTTPSNYVTAVNVQDEIFIRWDQVEQDYHPVALVTVEGEPKIAVHTIDAVAEPAWLPVEDYSRGYDLGTTPDRVARSELWFSKPAEPETEPLVETDFYLGEDIRLAGYHLDTREVTAGGYLPLTLVWEAQASDIPDLTIFTHLQGAGCLWGQLDGLPGCGEDSTLGWAEGDRIVDSYRIPIRVDTPPGVYPLRVGMYDRTTMARVSVYSGDGMCLGDGVPLADIEVNVR